MSMVVGLADAERGSVEAILFFGPCDCAKVSVDMLLKCHWMRVPRPSCNLQHPTCRFVRR